VGGGFPCCCREQVPDCADRLFGAPDAESIPTSLQVDWTPTTSWTSYFDDTADKIIDTSACGVDSVMVDGAGEPLSHDLYGSGLECGTVKIANACGLQYGITGGGDPDDYCATWAWDFSPETTNPTTLFINVIVRLVVDEAGVLGTANHVWVHVSMDYTAFGQGALHTCGLKDLGPYDDFDIVALNETIDMYYSQATHSGDGPHAAGDPAAAVTISAP
jgi:hypothetical protein